MTLRLSRAAALLACLILVAGSVRGDGQTAPPQAVFPTRIEAVTVDVVVLDRDGNPVEGLTGDDFTVIESGTPQTITTFDAVSLAESAPAPPRASRISTNAAAPDTNRWFFLVFDDVHLSALSTRRAREAVQQFITEVLGAGDRVLIAPTSGAGWWTGTLPQDRESLVAFVAGLQGQRIPDTTASRIYDYEAMVIALDRDRSIFGEVARRFFDNGVISEPCGGSPEPWRCAELDTSSGIGLIRAMARQAYADVTVRLQASLETMARIAAALAEARGRKTLLLVSEGFVMDTTRPEFRELIQTAREANAAVHFLDVRDPGGITGQPGIAGGNAESGRVVATQDATATFSLANREAEGASSVALDTGGTIVSGANPLPGLRRIAAQRAYYLLGYSPTDTRRDGSFRKIQVTVNRPDVQIIARSGYYATADEPRPADPDRLDPALRAGLDVPFGASGIPLRMTSYVFGPRGEGRLQTMLVAEADVSALTLDDRGGRHAGQLDTFMTVAGASREAIERDQRVVNLDLPPEAFELARLNGIPLLREFALPAGRYQATLVVRDRATGMVGAVRHEFEVPQADQLRITTPLVTDTVQPGAAGQPLRLIPIARRAFPAGARLAIAFDVIGAAQTSTGPRRVMVEYSVRTPDGAQVTGAPAREVAADRDAGLAITIGVRLPDGPPGEYTLHIGVRDALTGRTVEHVEAITIGP